MAEAAISGLTSKILITIASPVFEKAYERAQSIYGAREELDEFRQTIGTIQAVLADAEKHRESSEAVKNWMERVRDVLYDADDLFDEVSTVNLLKQQMKGNQFLKKVRILLSKLNPIASNDSIAKKVKAIRKDLHRISDDMGSFGFVKCIVDEKPLSIRKEVIGAFVDPTKVIGRVYEKEVLLKFLFDESKDKESISVLGIVGIGGVGKTTLAQLIYNDDEVEKNFKCRWWVSISDIVDEKEVLEKISQSMGMENLKKCNVSMLQSKIKAIVRKVGKYLLVLDDVWDIASTSPTLWLNIMSLLGYGAHESKIVVTTRHLSVPRLMLKDNSQILELGGLSENKSWELFSQIAFTQEQQNDQEWVTLGREIVSKCANVPLAVKSIAVILRKKTTKKQWESIKNEKLLSDGTIMSALKLSYHHLPSYLKSCFAYCSLLPKGELINEDDLVYLWIAQGYVIPKDGETFEVAGHCYFMDLLNWSFFQVAIEGTMSDNQICYKMHDLVHDLARTVAGEEKKLLVEGSTCMQLQYRIRHLRVFYKTNTAWSIPSSLNVDRLRSFFFMDLGSLSPPIVDHLLTKSKLLRPLCLRGRHIKDVPSSIGELLHLRYLDLSWNDFEVLPKSITKLVNLITLNISLCSGLKTLPNDFNKLVNLRQLNTEYSGLSHMPPGLGELTELQSLRYFKVGRSSGGGKSCKLDELSTLNISGKLEIDFGDDEDEEECLKIPIAVTDLEITSYKGVRIPSLPTNLVRLCLYGCSTIKYLPPLRFLSRLEALNLSYLGKLEYVEDEDDIKQLDQATATTSSTRSIFLPGLKCLVLEFLPKLKRWSEKVEIAASFPLLQDLKVVLCGELVSMPQSPRLRKLELMSVNEELMQDIMSASLPCLDTLKISHCDWLKTFTSEALTSLRCLKFVECRELQKLQKSPSQLNNLERFEINYCPQLESWEEDNSAVDWDSLPSLRFLLLTEMSDTLPECLQRREDLHIRWMHLEWRLRFLLILKNSCGL